MNKTLEKRVEELEKNVFVNNSENPEGVFMRVIDSRQEAPPIEEQKSKPVHGWLFHNGKEELRIIRLKGETDKELSARAISEAKPLLQHPLAVPVFHEILEQT